MATQTAVANFLASLITHVSLHTGDPGQTGTSEVSGGTPTYARRPVTWSPASDGVAIGGEVVFDVPSGVKVTHVGYWNAANAGTFREYADSADITFNAQGQVKVIPRITIP